MLHAVILAGGGGTRLWPLSRAHYPKQFLKLLGAHTLLQETLLRPGPLIPPDRVWIVTSKEQEFLVRSQLAALPQFPDTAAHILVEPLGRNTAAAIGLAAIHLLQRDPDAVMAVMPADHWIARPDVFVTLLAHAAHLAHTGVLVTLGIVPDRPETGYGYIRRGEPLALPLTLDGGQITAYRVERFVEKPTAQQAQEYLDSGAYYWNGGIFLWQASTILAEIATYMPALAQGLHEIAQSLADNTSTRTLEAVYQRLEPISIDYGVLEHSSRIVVLPADIGWSDLGEWTTIHRLLPRDERGNSLSENVIDIDSENSLVYGSGRTIATIGLKDTVVIDTDDALLICRRDRTQEVKTIVQHLRGAEVTQLHRTVHRPWGTYTVLEQGTHFKVKRLVVYPGAALSLQLHHHRSEHWVVVSGTAHVTKGEQEFILHANQSTYVPQGTKHRLANPGAEPLEIIEVQTGSYLGEDDIVRFADLYRRV
ncbi:MAG: mannose-1-phosphate guanylyltransferase/mannose-6-phosphate isomerase [Candidatus Binatia bacterium]|nr:mannose-1-phosphate guanylyltransferase/mannose-6-phosphate isomerase [Candidatus Binatia bacterium]